MTTEGIHHVTALAGDPVRNLDFYRRVLGLRLVKRSVNHDSPTVHHFYYADAGAAPGTVLTFFPYPGAKPGRPGRGQASEVTFRVPEGSLDFWTSRLRKEGVDSISGPGERLGEEVVRFADPDGLPLELAAGDPDPAVEPWGEAPVPPEHAIRGFAGVGLTVAAPGPTARVLDEVLGLERAAESGARTRYRAAGEGAGTRLDLIVAPDAPAARTSAGTVHHVAWRAEDEEHQESLRRAAAKVGLDPTPPIDRFYFRSVYVREPGGVLFEIATDGPGFTRDEAPGELGSGLRLPPWLEERREELERELPPLE